jgi:hypothetical protein
MATTRVQLPDGNIGEFPAGMGQDQIQAVLAKQFPAPSQSTDPSGRTPTGEPAPDDARNGFQRMLDNMTTPDPRREEWQSPFHNAVDHFAQGAASNVLTPLAHPIKTAKGLLDLAHAGIEASQGNVRPAVDAAIPAVQGAMADPARAAGSLVGGAALGELGGAALSKLPMVPSTARASRVFADIEKSANDVPVYTDATGPAVQKFREFVDTGGRNSRVMTKLSKRIENLPPRPNPEPVPIGRPDRMLGAGTEDIPLQPSPAPRNPRMRPMAFDAKVNPEEPWEPRSGDNFAPISEYPGINPHYLSGSEHPELSGRVTPLQNPEQVTTRMGVLRRPKVFDAAPPAEPAPQPDYAPALKFPEARQFYSNVTEASRRPGFLRRAIESPSAPKQRLQLGGVREAMNSDLTNALPPELSDQYTNALREYARAKTLQKVGKGALLLGAGEAARRTGLLGKIVHQSTVGQ